MVIFLTIEEIRGKCKDELIEVTSHMLIRFQQRNISYNDIKAAIMSGEIIEDYPNDYPYPSCLICGYSINGSALHTVVGMSDTKLWLITAYKPDPEQWSEDFKVRRA
jgi:hypothetical protein